MIKYEVNKFGGDVTGKKEFLELIPQRLSSNSSSNTSQVVIFSAARGLTDLLTKFTLNKINNQRKEELFSSINNIHASLLNNDDNSTNKTYNSTLERLDSIINGVIFQNQLTRNAKEMILTFGERLMASILLECVFDEGKTSIIYPEEFLTIEDDNERIINLEQSKVKLQKILESNNFANKLLLIPGYYGISNANEIRVLGRSGTDYSATAIGYCLDASSVTIWKNVPGLQSADPALVDNTKHINELSYAEIGELSTFGAKILHEQAIFPAKQFQTTLLIRDFTNPEFQTIIVEESSYEGIKIITHKLNVSYLGLPNYTSFSSIHSSDLITPLNFDKYKIKYLSFTPSLLEVILDDTTVQSFTFGLGIKSTGQVIMENSLCLIACIGKIHKGRNLLLTKINDYVTNNNYKLYKLVTTRYSFILLMETHEVKNQINSLHKILLI